MKNNGKLRKKRQQLEYSARYRLPLIKIDLFLEFNCKIQNL